MAGGDLYSIVSQLESSGVFLYLLPFLLVFTVVFAILEKTALFGKSPEGNTKTGINAVVGIILGLLVASQWEIVTKMQFFLPKMSLVLIIFVMVLLLIGTIGVKVDKGAKGIFLLLLAIASIVGVYWSLGPDFDLRVPWWVIDNQTTIFWVTILLIILYVIVSGGKKKSGEGGSFIDKMSNFLGVDDTK
ncbi:MAG: hypothetical protein KKG60_03085 [Nanoarchaeota archaeon]|nr:hypothetical protein [Nanoarchaeota archaeon]